MPTLVFRVCSGHVSSGWSHERELLTHHMQMMTSAIYGHDLAPAVLADEKGNVVRVESAASPEWLERLFRPVCRICFKLIHA